MDYIIQSAHNGARNLESVQNVTRLSVPHGDFRLGMRLVGTRKKKKNWSHDQSPWLQWKINVQRSTCVDHSLINIGMQSASFQTHGESKKMV